MATKRTRKSRFIGVALAIAAGALLLAGVASALEQDWSPQARSHMSPPLTDPIAPFGSIVILKDTVPDSPELFGFFGPFGFFELGDDGAGALHDEERFPDLMSGSYFFNEFATPEWIVSVECDDPDSFTAEFYDPTFGSGAFAEVFLDGGEIVTCAFTNTRAGTIVVEKETRPAGSTQAFPFLTSYSNPFNLADGQSHDSGFLEPGTYSVVESVPAGWQLESATCDDGSDPSGVEVGPGETVTCTFVDTQLGRIVIEKNAMPDAAQVFDFIGDLGAFGLDDSPSTPVPDTATFSNRSPGTYTVVERDAAGWDLTGIACTDPDFGSTTSVATKSAVIDLDPGETVSCEFTNERLPGEIVIVKSTSAPSTVAFDFAEAVGKLPPFSLDTSALAPHPDRMTFPGLDKGTYTITEALSATWRLSSLACEDPDLRSTAVLDLRTAVIDLDWGETVTCTFGNEPRQHQVGVYDPGSTAWLLRVSDTATLEFNYGNPGDIGFMGDWDCDGVETPGVLRPGSEIVYLRNSNSTGVAHVEYPFPDYQPGDIVLAGDFDGEDVEGEACDTVGLYRPAAARVIISNRFGAPGLGDPEYTYGNPGDVAFNGDWDADGDETIGLYRNGTVLLRNEHTPGPAHATFFYGNPDDEFVFAGDWDGDDTTHTVGIHRPADALFGLRNVNDTGIGDVTLLFGDADDLRPVAGRFGPKPI